VLLPKQEALPYDWQPDHPISALVSGTFKKDIKVLWKDKKFRLVCCGFMLTFFIWGWFYVTFGPFLKELYALNTITFGAYSAITETIGDGIAMITYIYFGLFGSNQMNHLPPSKASRPSRRRVIHTEMVLLVSSMMLFASLLILSLMLHVPSLQAVLETNQMAVGIVMILYFVGHEGCVIGLMILHVEVASGIGPHIQPRASGVVSMISCVMVFISQSIIIGPLNSEYYTITFKSECVALLIFSSILMAVIGALTITMHRSRGATPRKQVSPLKIPEHGQSGQLHTIHPFPARKSKRATMATPINGNKHLTPIYTFRYGPSTTDFVFDKKKPNGRRR